MLVAVVVSIEALAAVFLSIVRRMADPPAIPPAIGMAIAVFGPKHATTIAIVQMYIPKGRAKEAKISSNLSSVTPFTLYERAVELGPA